MWKETGTINILASGNILELYQKEWEIAGKIKIFENVRRPPWVRLIFKKDDKILLTKEFRSEHNKFDYRLPGGKVFDTLADMRNFSGDILDAARWAVIREAKEECGFDVRYDSLELFIISPCWATIEWDLYYFIVSDFDDTGMQDLEEWEYITFDWYNERDIIELVRKNEISEDRSKWILWQYFLQNN